MTQRRDGGEPRKTTPHTPTQTRTHGAKKGERPQNAGKTEKTKARRRAGERGGERKDQRNTRTHTHNPGGYPAAHTTPHTGRGPRRAHRAPPGDGQGCTDTDHIDYVAPDGQVFHLLNNPISKQCDFNVRSK